MKQPGKQQTAAVMILMATKNRLERGRTRKLPGKPRAEAMACGPSPVSYKSPYAQRYSLGGAIKASALALHTAGACPKATLSRARHQAERAVIAALFGGDDPSWLTVTEVDDAIADTREIQRALTKAIHQLA